MRSLKSIKWGDVNSPVLYPALWKIAANMCETEPLPWCLQLDSLKVLVRKTVGIIEGFGVFDKSFLSAAGPMRWNMGRFSYK